MTSCSEKFGNNVESFISGKFSKLGLYVGEKPRKVIILSFLLTALCGVGFLRWSTENRPDKLWVPQDTLAEQETDMYQSYFGTGTRANTVIISDENVLKKEVLVESMLLHSEILSQNATVEDVEYTFSDLCVKVPFGGGCVAEYGSQNILSLWNYDLETLNNDGDVLATINAGYSTSDLDAMLGNTYYDSDGALVKADAFVLTYLTVSRADDISDPDPINEGWEEDVFLKILEQDSPLGSYSVEKSYFAGRSFSDEFGGAIQGDLVLVQISYAVVFLFLGANMGRFLPGPESRWTMSLAALVLVGLSTATGFGISSAFGLFFGPVHSLLPFILLGIGVDDAFVIVNAFNRERKGPRSAEDNTLLAKRSARALARAGASITVTSLTDLVAFGISASSSLPALASFCAYASIAIIFLWVFASTFFASTLVLDERRQRDNRRECLCCLKRPKDLDEQENDKYQEGRIAKYFRNFHAPVILSKIGKLLVVCLFSGMLGFGIWGAMNLSVEDTQRSFIPPDSYLTQFINDIDEYYPTSGIGLAIVFEGGSNIYGNREQLSKLDERLSGLSTEKARIAEPNSDSAYSNVMAGYYAYQTSIGEDWPQSESEFVSSLRSYTLGAGRQYAADVAFNANETSISLDAIRVNCEYVALTKEKRNGDIIDDSDMQIEAMDATRDIIDSWSDLQPAFPYSEKFIAIEGFKIIRKELFLNVGLALGAVGIIVFFTVASPITSLLITFNVAACIIEILGFMHAIDIAIDSVSVINIVLAVGLSIDYSAHVGHCFMLKGGEDKDRRVLEALSDIGSAVLSGAISTFLAVVVLLFSKSYVFVILSKQFALTVGLGIVHGLVLLPVLLSLFGPKAFKAAEMPED